MMKSSREIVMKGDRAFRQKLTARSTIASVVNPWSFASRRDTHFTDRSEALATEVLFEMWGTQETRKLDGRTKLDTISAIARNDWPHFATQFPCVSVDNTRPLCGQVN